MMGSGANVVTGDFSCGAAGLWIENGQIAYSVEEVTIAGSMFGILNNIEKIGSDLIFNSSIASPSFLVNEMTISGS
jgi:PmbA protein